MFVQHSTRIYFPPLFANDLFTSPKSSVCSLPVTQCNSDLHYLQFPGTLNERNLIRKNSLPCYLIGVFWLRIVTIRIHKFAESKSIAYISLCSSVADAAVKYSGL